MVSVRGECCRNGHGDTLLCVASKWFGKHVSAATNTHATTEDYAVRVVSKESKAISSSQNFLLTLQNEYIRIHNNNNNNNNLFYLNHFLSILHKMNKHNSTDLELLLLLLFFFNCVFYNFGIQRMDLGVSPYLRVNNTSISMRIIHLLYHKIVMPNKYH
jgi:hypothetical protein